MSVFQGKARAD